MEAVCCKKKPGALVGQLIVVTPPVDCRERGGSSGCVTEAQVKPRRNSSVVSFAGLVELLAARKKKRSICCRSAPPSPTGPTVGPGAVAAPNVAAGGFNQRSHKWFVPLLVLNV